MGQIEKEEKWNPTPEQFAAYKAREIVLARRNIAQGRKAAGKNFQPVRDTLHSLDTILASYEWLPIRR